MKQFLKGLGTVYALVLLLAVIVMGQATSSAVDVTPTLYFDHVATFTADTLVGTTTADTLIDEWSPKAGFEYVLNLGAWEDAGGDSVDCEIIIEALNSSGRRLSSVAVDTVTDSAGSQTLLKFGNVICGQEYRVFIRGITGIGAKIVPEDSVYIFRRKLFGYIGR
jgi:hypothetical protein